MIRRILIVALLVTLLSCACARQPVKSGTIRFYDIANLDMRDVPLLMALDDLRGQGYTVETTYMASSSLIAEALARGDADLALLNNLTMWNAVAKGVDARTLVEPVASTTLLVAQTSITHCSQLNGLGVGLASASGLSTARLEYYFDQVCPGIVPNYAVISESSGRSAGLLSQDLAAAVIPAEELLKLQQGSPGKLHILADVAAIFATVRQDGIHARYGWARENPSIIKDFLKALLSANRKVLAERKLLIQQSMKRLEMDEATAGAIADMHLSLGTWDANGGLTPELVQSTLDFLTEIGSLKTGQSVSDVSDLSYLQAVLAEIGVK
jgi:hypothetical protein